jgi:restriction endonuclease S subunit
MEIQHGTILSRVKDPLQRESNAQPLLAMQDLSYELGLTQEKPGSSHEYVNPDSVEKCTFGYTGDVIIGLTVGKAMVIEEEYDGFLVPSNFALLQFDHQVIHPFYLMWYINESPDYLRQSELFTQGTSVRSLSIRELREIDIALPPFREQRAIGELYRSVLRMEKLSHVQKNLYLQLIKGITTSKEEQ